MSTGGPQYAAEVFQYDGLLGHSSGWFISPGRILNPVWRYLSTWPDVWSRAREESLTSYHSAQQLSLNHHLVNISILTYSVSWNPSGLTRQCISCLLWGKNIEIPFLVPDFSNNHCIFPVLDISTWAILEFWSNKLLFINITYQS